MGVAATRPAAGGPRRQSLGWELGVLWAVGWEGDLGQVLPKAQGGLHGPRALVT